MIIVIIFSERLVVHLMTHSAVHHLVEKSVSADNYGEDGFALRAVNLFAQKTCLHADPQKTRAPTQPRYGQGE